MTSLAIKRQETRKLLRSVLLPNKRGLLLTDLEKEYRGMTGSSLPYKSLGYASLSSLLLDMADVATLEKLPSGHQMVLATPDKSTQHIAAMVSCQRDNMEGYNQNTGRVLAGQSRQAKAVAVYPEQHHYSVDKTVPAHIKHKLGKLLFQFPSGLAYSQLSGEYRQLHCEELDPLSCGQTSGLELCCQLPDMVQIQQLDREGRDWLLLPVGSLPGSSQHSAGGDQTDRSSLSQFSDRLEVQQLPSSVCVGDSLEVMVTAVRSPSKIYVQLRNMQDKLSELAEAMAKEIQIGPEGELRPMEMKLGMNLALKKDSQWYRVIVLRIKDMSRMKVFFCDYGIIQTVPVASLRYLPRQLGRLPAQAIPASLASLTLPVCLARWPHSTCVRLKELVVASQGLAGWVVAQVRRVQNQHSRLAVWLVDTQGVAINQVLETEGMAEKEICNQLGNRQQQLLDRLIKVSKLARERLERNTLDDTLDRLESLVSDLETELIPDNVGMVVRTVVGQEQLHVVSWHGRCWCASKEIANLVQDWRGWDLLDRMVDNRNMDLERVVINRDVDTKLWEQMDRSEVGEVGMGEMSLYILGDVPCIVRTFARPETWGGIIERLEEIVTVHTGLGG